MSLVVHTINGNKYIYDHHRLGPKVKTTYLGPEKDILIKSSISSEGYPVSSPDYPKAHRAADKAELSEYGKKKWDEVEKIGEKMPKSELAGSHNDKIIVSKKVPKEYRGQVLYHERREKEIMDGVV